MLGVVLDRLLADKIVVSAVAGALETHSSIAAAVAAVSANPAVAAAVSAAVIAGDPPEPPLPPPPGGSDGAGGGNGRLSYRERVARFVERFAPERGRLIAAGTDDVIARAIAEAARDGVFGEAAVAARVTAALTGVRAATWRARRIARTETGAAQNAALLEMAGARGKPFEKTWVAIEDARTRPTHAAADGQTVSGDALFSVGGAAMAHPGDPSAPLSEIVNCRCTMLLREIPE
jgi:hypothetical protein